MFSLLCIKVKKWDWEGGEISCIYILNKVSLFCTNVWKVCYVFNYFDITYIWNNVLLSSGARWSPDVVSGETAPFLQQPVADQLRKIHQVLWWGLNMKCQVIKTQRNMIFLSQIQSIEEYKFATNMPKSGKYSECSFVDLLSVAKFTL